MKQSYDRSRGTSTGIPQERCIPTDYLCECARALTRGNVPAPATPGYDQAQVISLITQDIGLDRSNQEDAAIVQYYEGLLLGKRRSLIVATLADGCGGAYGGEVASAIACAKIQQVVLAGMQRIMVDENPNFTVFAAATIHDCAFAAANRSILGQADEDPSLTGMASTGVCCIAIDSYAYIAWAGDSRLYVYRNGSLTLVTHDHNRAQTLVDEGIITPEDASRHPGRSHLTNALGTHDSDEGIPECAVWNLCAGDLLILSSDGFHEGLTATEISTTCAEYLRPPVAQEDLRIIAKTLETESMGQYGSDNLTAVFIYFGSLPQATKGW